MADQGLWFKLWCAALDDPQLDNLPMDDFGRWAKLGAFLKRHGRAGEVRIEAPARLLCAAFQVPDFAALVAMFQRLPGVIMRSANGSVPVGTIVYVSLLNWAKYQGDLSTSRTRRFRARERSRGEEKEKEKEKETRVLSPTSLTTDPFADQHGKGTTATVPPHEPPAEPMIAPTFWAQINQALEDCPTLGRAPRLREMGYWAALLGAHDVDPVAEIRKAHAWVKANPSRAPKRDLGRFMLNWARRAAEG